MDLSTRLRSLQKSAGMHQPPAMPATQALPPASPPTRSPHSGISAPDPAPSRRHPDNSPDQREAELALALQARVLTPGLLLVEQALGPQHVHGGIELSELQQLQDAVLGMPLPASSGGWWFMDTETTGLAGGTGTLVFLYGGLHFDGQCFTLRQWLLTRLAGEPALIDCVMESLQQSALMVSFNGKSFDMPLLRTRARLQRRILPEQHLRHLDLLHPARSAFAQRWPDVRLQTAERRLCQFRRVHDLPGSEAPLAFLRWLREGTSAGLQRVVEHHRNDVLSLAGLTVALARAFLHPHLHDADAAGIVRRLRRQGYQVREGQAQLAFAP